MNCGIPRLDSATSLLMDYAGQNNNNKTNAKVTLKMVQDSSDRFDE